MPPSQRGQTRQNSTDGKKSGWRGSGGVGRAPRSRRLRPGAGVARAFRRARAFSGRPGSAAPIAHPASRPQRPGDGPDVVAHHGEITRRRAICPGEGVGEEGAADGGAGLADDLLQKPGVGDVLHEHGADALGADLPDQRGHLGGGGLGLGVDPDRGQEGQAIGLGK